LDSLKGDLITQPFSCVLEAEKHRCINGGGACNISQDGTFEHAAMSNPKFGLLTNSNPPGYYIVNVMCVLVGAITFFMFIRPQALKLQQLPLRAWRISEN
jgi:PAT family acetyl-CoA transporter-like MFS transporter 1